MVMTVQENPRLLGYPYGFLVPLWLLEKKKNSAQRHLHHSWLHVISAEDPLWDRSAFLSSPFIDESFVN
jgi:hypothetical protein